MNVNIVNLAGRLTRDPELRYTNSGNAVCNFGIAINRKFGDREETVFVDIESWNKQAELINEHLAKGRHIFLEGRLRLDAWETKDGEKRSQLKVVLNNFQFIQDGSPRNNTNSSQESPSSQNSSSDSGEGDFDDRFPF